MRRRCNIEEWGGGISFISHYLAYKAGALYPVYAVGSTILSNMQKWAGYKPLVLLSITPGHYYPNITPPTAYNSSMDSYVDRIFCGGGGGF